MTLTAEDFATQHPEAAARYPWLVIGRNGYTIAAFRTYAAALDHAARHPGFGWTIENVPYDEEQNR